MAETRGFVHKVKILPGIATAFVYIGPDRSNVELFYVLRPRDIDEHIGATMNNMIDACGAALLARREIVVTHPTGSQEISGLRFDPM